MNLIRPTLKSSLMTWRNCIERLQIITESVFPEISSSNDLSHVVRIDVERSLDVSAKYIPTLKYLKGAYW